MWFFFYFATERGRRGLIDYRRDLARLLWTQLSLPQEAPQAFATAVLDLARAGQAR